MPRLVSVEGNAVSRALTPLRRGCLQLEALTMKDGTTGDMGSALIGSVLKVTVAPICKCIGTTGLCSQHSTGCMRNQDGYLMHHLCGNRQRRSCSVGRVDVGRTGTKANSLCQVLICSRCPLIGLRWQTVRLRSVT